MIADDFTGPPGRSRCLEKDWRPAKDPSRPTFMQALAIGLAATAAANQSAGVSPLGVAPLLVFGGEGHKTFLGCLNCSKFDANSVMNEFGQYGSAYSTVSILNQFSEFGSPYSTHSACGPYASDPPVIVDRAGNYYGRLTVNRFADPTHVGNWSAWISAVCQK
jgi:hypothetical protein